MARTQSIRKGPNGLTALTSTLQNETAIVVTCLGGSTAASDCFRDLNRLINDVLGTRLVRVSDDATAAQARVHMQTLDNGAAVTNDCICVVVNNEGAVQGSVPPTGGSLDAFVLWGQAVQGRG